MAKGHHEPRGKDGWMCPDWVRSEVAKLLNGLDGRHDEVMVAAVALLGEGGFDVGCVEQSTNFDPSVYGPAMLEGCAIISGNMLAKVLGTVHASVTSESSFTRTIEDDAERMAQVRNLYEQAIRQFLESAMTYAGAAFQEQVAKAAQENPPKPPAEKTKRLPPHVESEVAGSQLIALWLQISRSTIKFQAPADGERGDSPQKEG